VTGSPDLVASMMKARVGIAPKVLTCLPVNGIQAASGPLRILPWMSALRLATFGLPTTPERRT
jgi:hypothetical protein